MKVLKDKPSPEDSSDFIKEVQNMIELESKQHCQYIIKLRGVAKSMFNFLLAELPYMIVLYDVHNHVKFCISLEDGCCLLYC